MEVDGSDLLRGALKGQYITQVPEQQTREFMENLKVINHKNSKNQGA